MTFQPPPSADENLAWYLKRGSLGNGGQGQQSPTWFIDPVNGSDNAGGTTNITPLKTLGRLLQLVAPDGLWFLNSDSTVTWLNSTPANTDTHTLLVVRQNGATLTLQGSLRQVPGSPTGDTFTAIVAENRATGRAWEVTAGHQAAGFWSAYVGKVLLDVTQNTYSWVNSNLGAATARIDAPLVMPPVPVVSFFDAPTLGTVVANDVYQILQPLTVNIAAIYIFDDGAEQAPKGALNILFLYLVDPPGYVTLLNGAPSGCMRLCQYDLLGLESSSSLMVNCHGNSLFSDGALDQGPYVIGGDISGGQLQCNASMSIDGDALLAGMTSFGIGSNGVLQVLLAGFFEGTNNIHVGLNVQGGTLIVRQSFEYPGIQECLWGTRGMIFIVQDGASVLVDPGLGTFVNTLPGCAGTFTLGTQVTASAYNRGTGVWTGGIPCTIANMDGAFNGFALDPPSETRFARATGG